MAFHSCGPRNDWVWILASGEAINEDLRGRGVAQLSALFKIRTVFSEAGGVRCLPLLPLLNLINCCRSHLASGHIQVGKRSSGGAMSIVDIATVIGQAYALPPGRANG